MGVLSGWLLRVVCERIANKNVSVYILKDSTIKVSSNTYPRRNLWHDPNHVSNPNYPKKDIFVDHGESIQERCVHEMCEKNRKREKGNIEWNDKCSVVKCSIMCDVR